MSGSMKPPTSPEVIYLVSSDDENIEIKQETVTAEMKEDGESVVDSGNDTFDAAPKKTFKRIRPLIDDSDSSDSNDDDDGFRKVGKPNGKKKWRPLPPTPTDSEASGSNESDEEIASRSQRLRKVREESPVASTSKVARAVPQASGTRTSKRVQQQRNQKVMQSLRARLSSSSYEHEDDDESNSLSEDENPQKQNENSDSNTDSKDNSEEETGSADEQEDPNVRRSSRLRNRDPKESKLTKKFEKLRKKRVSRDSSNSSTSDSESEKGEVVFESEDEDESFTDKSRTTSEDSEYDSDPNEKECVLCRNLGNKVVQGRSADPRGHSWCRCGECEVKDNWRDYDRICCRELKDVVAFIKTEKALARDACVTSHMRFQLDVIERRALERSRYDPTKNYDRSPAFMCAWSYLRWIWDRVGKRTRMVIPACVRKKIQKARFGEVPNFYSVKTCKKKHHCRLSFLGHYRR